MKKNGFTLFEVLAVLIILSILSIITIPFILNFVKASEKSAFESGMKNLVDSAKVYFSTNALEYNDEDIVFDLSDSSNKLDYKGEKMVSGTVTYKTNGSIILREVTNGKYCANGIGKKITVVSGDNCPDTIVVENYPIFKVVDSNPKPSFNGFYEDRKVEIKYGYSESAKFYVKSSIPTIIDTNLTYNCGNGEAPNVTCDSVSTSTMEANYWYYQESNSNPKITEQDNGDLYAYVEENNVLSELSVYNETKIDTIPPTKPVINLYTGSDSLLIPYVSGTISNGGIKTVINSTDNESGIFHYEFSTDGINWSKTIFSTSSLVNYSYDKSIFSFWTMPELDVEYYVRAVDKFGNRSPVSDPFRLKIIKCEGVTYDPAAVTTFCSKTCGGGDTMERRQYYSTIDNAYFCRTEDHVISTNSCNTQACTVSLLSKMNQTSLSWYGDINYRVLYSSSINLSLYTKIVINIQTWISSQPLGSIEGIMGLSTDVNATDTNWTRNCVFSNGATSPTTSICTLDTSALTSSRYIKIIMKRTNTSYNGNLNIISITGYTS